MISCHTTAPVGICADPSSQYAVLFLSYGGPDSLDDIEPYLLDIRGGRQTPTELVDEIRERYAKIGGKSPLLEITCNQAEDTEALLNRNVELAAAAPFRVYIGMRHWTPFIKDTIAEMVHNGVKKMVVVCMTPYYSKMTVGSYREKFDEAIAALGANDLHIIFVNNWHTHPLYIQAIAEKVKEGLTTFPPELRDTAQLIFTAHSLPASIIEQGDPYDAHLKETVALVIEQLTNDSTVSGNTTLANRVHFCYQSAGARKVVWLGPPLESVITDLADAGNHALLVAPIGFLVDHVEILYDIDIECKELAREHGAHLERTESQNTSPTFIAALADIVQQAIAHHAETA